MSTLSALVIILLLKFSGPITGEEMPVEKQRFVECTAAQSLFPSQCLSLSDKSKEKSIYGK